MRGNKSLASESKCRGSCVDSEGEIGAEFGAGQRLSKNLVDRGPLQFRAYTDSTHPGLQEIGGNTKLENLSAKSVSLYSIFD